MIFQFCLNILLSLWFYREIKHFPFKINRQIYDEYHYLAPIQTDYAEFLATSRLQPKQIPWLNLAFICLPLICFFLQYTLWLNIILLILLFLSILDYLYYLTDIKYILLLLIFNFYPLLFEQPVQSHLYFYTFFITLLFFMTFHLLIHTVTKKELLGNGDMALFVVLSVALTLTEMIQLLLYASLLAIGFYLLYGGIKKQKLTKIPFIPFIALAFWWLKHINLVVI